MFLKQLIKIFFKKHNKKKKTEDRTETKPQEFVVHGSLENIDIFSSFFLAPLHLLRILKSAPYLLHFHCTLFVQQNKKMKS